MSQERSSNGSTGMGLAAAAFALAAGSFLLHWMLAVPAIALGVYSYYSNAQDAKAAGSSGAKVVALLAIVLAILEIVLTLGFNLKTIIL
ncbi:MAG TPA: hypothetical protein VMR98_04460 [Candidatus Polarisedimenticolaceae bacterium]|nr:hypothetical protein [Candidatus Polarisedimenticolaceae bacterium]